MVDIENLKINYFSNEEPVPYKVKTGKELKIYPITVKEYPVYESCKSVLEIKKETVNNAEVIQMSYLRFLTDIALATDGAIEILGVLLALCFKKNVGLRRNNEKVFLYTTDDEGNTESVISEKEFDDIKKIILYQNDIDYDDRYVNPDVQKEYEKWCALKSKKVHNPSLEEKKTYVMSRTGYSMKDINEMIYRTFTQVFSHCVNSEIYLSQKIIQASFKYEIKDDIKFPLFEPKVDKYKEMFKDAETFEKKIQAVNG